jgi:hypothetical protein
MELTVNVGDKDVRVRVLPFDLACYELKGR